MCIRACVYCNYDDCKQFVGIRHFHLKGHGMRLFPTAKSNLYQLMRVCVCVRVQVYKVLFPYLPGKDDELELQDGDYVYVSTTDQGHTGDCGCGLNLDLLRERSSTISCFGRVWLIVVATVMCEGHN